MSGRVACLCGLYGLTPTEMARGMADSGEALAAQLAELERDPTPERCDRAAAALAGARAAVLRLRTGVERYVGTPPDAA